MKPIYIAFVWHQHQPYYRTSAQPGPQGDFALPWVRLHAVKDYLHMLEALTQHPSIHQTFNLVPSLIEQLHDYTERGVMDRSLRLTLTPAEDLSDADKAEMLETFFYINWERVISRYPRYHQLLALKQQAQGDAALFGPAFWRDLQVWFNLAWIDPLMVAADAELNALREQGRDFSQADVNMVADKHWAMMADVVPVHRTMMNDGQIEVSTSPYFHPILPLLDDNYDARTASPGLALPAMRFAHPEDAAAQMLLAVDSYRAAFGRPPAGMWPSEGAVSQEVVALAAAHGIRWFASDEAVLASSVGYGIERDPWGHLTNPWLLYQPYLTNYTPPPLGEAGWANALTPPPSGEAGWGSASTPPPLGEAGWGSAPTIIFRDHLLSDRIGFAYQGMETHAAVADMLDRLHTIRNRTQDGDRPALVSIILDGENCWEGYPNNGNDFLHALYSAIERDDTLHACTVSEYLAAYPPTQQIEKLFTASWIGRNLETWIGEAEQNRAWEYLAATREQLVTYPPPNIPPAGGRDNLSIPRWGRQGEGALAAAWRELYIAEGSDWFWWYYSHNSSAEEALFDEMFRCHLGNVYTMLGLPVPAFLKQPIRGLSRHTLSREPGGYISPRISGAADASEWGNAGYIEPQASSGSMQISYLPLKRLYYGSNPANLFFRLEANEDIRADVALYIRSHRVERYNPTVRYGGPVDVSRSGFSHELLINADSGQVILSEAEGQGMWRMQGAVGLAAHGQQVLEMSVPLEALGLQLGDTIQVAATITTHSILQQVLPTIGVLEVDIRAWG